MQDHFLSKPNETPECYQTGSTQPPKTHNSVIAILLVLVILLSGIVSVLGLMNVHLFRTLVSQQEEAALAFESVPADTSFALAQYPSAAGLGGRSAIGISAQDISSFHAAFYQVPQGVYVPHVSAQSDAFTQGLRAKDIILNFDGIRVMDRSSLKAQLDSRLPGDRVTMTVYRNGKLLDFSITLLEE